jgi:hypothetical protein
VSRAGAEVKHSCDGFTEPGFCRNGLLSTHLFTQCKAIRDKSRVRWSRRSLLKRLFDVDTLRNIVSNKDAAFSMYACSWVSLAICIT